MHELIIPQGKMEKGWIFLQTQHQLILTIQHLSCPRNLKKKKELKCKTNFNLHYRGKGYGGQEFVNCSKQCA